MPRNSTELIGTPNELYYWVPGEMVVVVIVVVLVVLVEVDELEFDSVQLYKSSNSLIQFSGVVSFLIKHFSYATITLLHFRFNDLSSGTLYNVICLGDDELCDNNKLWWW